MNQPAEIFEIRIVDQTMARGRHRPLGGMLSGTVLDVPIEKARVGPARVRFARQMQPAGHAQLEQITAQFRFSPCRRARQAEDAGYGFSCSTTGG